MGRIEIEKSEELFESAKRGCLYCKMVCIALSTIHPGWESEQSFIRIFLALGLPVFVQLSFGVISTITHEKEEAMDLFGIEIPEGRQLTTTIQQSNFSNLAIDVEIHRVRLSLDETTVADLVLSPLVENIGIAETILPHAGEEECFDFIKENVANCIKEHKCGRDRHLPLLPDRVIWVEADIASRIRLVEPRNIRAEYIALSYCWGSVNLDTYLTDASTFNERKAGMQYNDLPPLIQDIVDCARKLGIEYIWIDRLCIIQGDVQDFKYQAPKMGEIYGNATLTIAAASASSENDRILVKRDIKYCAYMLNMEINGIGSLKLRFRRRTHPLFEEYMGGNYGKISTRAWIWQERLLSTRTIFYTASALKFECRHHSIWEGFSQDVTSHSWSAQLDNISHRSWLTLVDEYTSKDISRPSDRLPAMEAVMKRIQKSKGWSPLWGMWTNMLVESLGWKSKESRSGSRFGGKQECRMNPEHWAPTWSWASVDGPVSHINTIPFEDSYSELGSIVFDLDVLGINDVSGLITFAGQLISVELSCDMELIEQHEENNSTEGNKLKYNYAVLGVYKDGQPYAMQPDVPLKPWSGSVNGRHISSVIRVPYGEPLPEKSWTAPCLCLLVGRMKLRSLVLFLGSSLRESGRWERIGMADGLPPDIFKNSRRLNINVV
ncbi:HET domain containing protein [Hyaloscypha variabilis]